MRSGSWTTGPIRKPSARVSLDGANRAVESVSVSRELPSVLPGQVATTGGITAATGDVEWAQTATVTDRVPTPWTRSDYPSRGGAVGVWASDGTNEHKVFTGVTDGTTGHFADTDHSTSLVDGIDQLNRPFSMEPLARVMPPRSTTSDGRRRMIGLNPQYFTNRVLREAGFYTTPPQEGFCVASAPLVGSTWPERGTLENSYRADDEFGYSRYNPTFAFSSKWGGLGTSNVVATYNIDTSVHSGHITADRPLNITMMVGVTHRVSGYVAAAWGDQRQIRLAVTSNRDLVAQTRDAAGTVVNLLTVTGTEAGDFRAATLRVENVGTTTFKYTLRTDTGHEESVTATRVTGTGADPVAQMWVYAPDNRIGGAQLSFTSIAWTALGYTQNAWMDAPVSVVNLDAIPGIEGGNCLDLLRAQSEAECAAFWLDEDGVLRWKARVAFRETPVTRTLTAVDDLLDVSFRMDGQDVRRKVTVKYRRPAVSTARSSSIVCYEGAKTELEPGDNLDLWISPPDEQDWIAVDSNPRVILGGWGTTIANNGGGSWIGFKGLDADGDEISVMNGDSPLADWSYSLSKISVKTWRHQIDITSLPTGVDRVETGTRSEPTSDLKPSYRDRGLPILRCMGLITWTDQETSPGITGPSWAADLEHDVSWFIQEPGEVSAIANWLANQVSAPHPVVESVNIIPDPRIQLGDKVTVSDPVRTGVTITGVVIGVSQSISLGDHTMSLKLLVTAVVVNNVRLDEFENFHNGVTVASLENLYAPSTVATMENDPLRV